jgi:pseudoazurin
VELPINAKLRGDRSVAAAVVLLGSAIVSPLGAEEVAMQMLNAGADGLPAYQPALVRIAPGDSVRFVPVDVAGHNAASHPAMLPEGAEPFEGGLDEELVVTFDVPGVYGIICTPHAVAGMVGLVVVGEDLANLDAARAVQHEGLAQVTFERLFAELGAP